MNKEQLKILEKLPQFPDVNKAGGELRIGKNDPKNGMSDYWFCSYGAIYLSGFYSLPEMLAQLADGCVKCGYIEREENALIKN